MNSDPKYVYHGSHEKFEPVIPKQNRRFRNGVKIFDQISFHATPYYWIALAYTCKQKSFEIEGKTFHYMMGVDLYKHDLTVCVIGHGSLEKSLKDMYEDGGYVYTFSKEDFFHTEGLGDLEVICTDSREPVNVEYIKDPVAEMKKLGVHFIFQNMDDEKVRLRWK